MIKAIIFDCFGVLVSDVSIAFAQGAHDKDPASAERLKSLFTALDKGQIETLAGHNEIASELQITLDQYYERINTGEVKNTALLDYILELRSDYKIGLLSNINSGGLSSRFTSDELKKHFDVVVASGDIGYAKPEAAAFQYTADKLGVRADECIMIDDRPDYCDGATAAGLHAIQYESLGQLKTDLAALL